MPVPFKDRQLGEFSVGDKVAVFNTDGRTVRRFGIVTAVRLRFYDLKDGVHSKPASALWGERYGDLVTVRLVVYSSARGQWAWGGHEDFDEGWLMGLDAYVSRERDRMDQLRAFLK